MRKGKLHRHMDEQTTPSHTLSFIHTLVYTHSLTHRVTLAAAPAEMTTLMRNETDRCTMCSCVCVCLLELRTYSLLHLCVVVNSTFSFPCEFGASLSEECIGVLFRRVCVCVCVCVCAGEVRAV